MASGALAVRSVTARLLLLLVVALALSALFTAVLSSRYTGSWPKPLATDCVSEINCKHHYHNGNQDSSFHLFLNKII
jgi:hypothetical protein